MLSFQIFHFFLVSISSSGWLWCHIVVLLWHEKSMMKIAMQLEKIARDPSRVCMRGILQCNAQKLKSFIGRKLSGTSRRAFIFAKRKLLSRQEIECSRQGSEETQQFS
jgi:hypothetical protein